jgi:hypothetical protein
MDSKELRGLYEAYSEVYAPQQIDEISQKTATSAYAQRRTGEFEGDDASDRVAKTNKLKGRIEKKFGAKAGEHAEKAADVKTFGRKDASGRRQQRPEPRIQTSDHENQREFKRELRIKRDRRLRAARGEDTNEQVDIFDVVLEFLQVEGYVETLEEAEWLMANVIDEEAIDIILGEEKLDEAIYSEKGKAKAAEMIAKRSTPSGRAKSGKGANVAQIRQIRGSGRGRFDREGLGGTPMTPTMAKNPIKKQNYDGTGNKAARRAGTYQEEFELWVNSLVEEGYNLSGYTWDEMYEFYLDEAQVANRDPDKYEREQSKKSAPVRGEKTPMPPRGDKRREDFEKWYAANVR